MRLQTSFYFKRCPYPGQVLVNAETGQVDFRQFDFSGYATYQALELD